MGKLKLSNAIDAVVIREEKAFIPYIMAGDGGLEQLKDQILFLQRAGVTAIELGIPFSDPVADGPTIQAAGFRALENGVTLKQVLAELKSIKLEVNVPLILMTYLNPIFQFGIPLFAEECEASGVDGIIIPDLPFEEKGLVKEDFDRQGLALIQLVSLTSPKERIQKITGVSDSFVYAVAVKGITGARSTMNETLEDFIGMIKEVSPLPVLIGFGISTPEHVRKMGDLADGVIVGSKIIDLFQENNREGIYPLIQASSAQKR
jgi:tryptophan synthase alpha chain